MKMVIEVTSPSIQRMEKTTTEMPYVISTIIYLLIKYHQQRFQSSVLKCSLPPLNTNELELHRYSRYASGPKYVQALQYRKCIQGHISIHAIFAVFIYFSYLSYLGYT